MNDASLPTRLGHWCCFTEADTEIRIWINDPPDTIQTIIDGTGTFYEIEALRLLRALLPPAPRIVDVGANFGNHSIYFARICDAAWLLPIEPNPEVIPELRANLAANGCDADLSCLGVAAGSRRGELHLCQNPADAAFLNRGGTRLVDGATRSSGPSVSVMPLDELVSGQVDLLKIDVEGMAVPVLEGAHEVIARYAPLIFVEVSVLEMSAFFDWLSASSYRVAGALSDYAGLTNLVLQPSTSVPRGVARRAADPEARIAEALTKAAAASAHAEQADGMLRSTLARSGALHRSHVAVTEQLTAQVASLTQTVQQLNDEISRLRAIELSTTWQATLFLRKVGGYVPDWPRNALRRMVRN